MTEQIGFVKSGLRLDAFKKNVPIMQKEATSFFGEWGNSGEKELLTEMNRLTILTASRCLLGLSHCFR
jgi:sterol 14-demethylase